MNERIKEIRAYFCNGNNKDFAELMGESTSTTSGWISGKRGIGMAVSTKIISKFPQVNKNWLLTGEGSMLKDVVSEPPQNYTVPQAQEVIIQSNDSEKTMLIQSINRMTETADRNSRTLEKLVDYLVSQGTTMKFPELEKGEENNEKSAHIDKARSA